MSEKHRALPPWMVKKEEKVKKKEPVKSRRKRKIARAAFYCMNEKELLEAAVSYLTTCEDVTLLTDQEKISKAVTSEETCHVSETDLDVTEVETVPSTKSLQLQTAEGQRSGKVKHHGGLVNVGEDVEEEEEDDALQLVREIFFT